MIDELTRVVPGTIDESRFAASKDRQTKGVQAWRINNASVVPQVSFVINHWHVQPTVVGPESRRPDNRPKLSIPQIERQR